MNRKFLAVSLLTVLMAATLGSAAGARERRMPRNVSKRSVSAGYNYAASSSEQPIQYQLAEPLEIEVEKKELWANIAIDDTTMRQVGAEVTQDVDGDGTADSRWNVCGETDSALRIVPGKPLSISLVAGVCAEPGSATSGTVYVDLFSPARKAVEVPAIKVERELSATYLGAVYQTEATNGLGGWRVETMVSEQYLQVTATDATGLPTHIEIFPESSRKIDVCGPTEGPIEIAPGTEVVIRLSPLPCDDGSPVAVTTGTVQVTLSNAP